MNADDTLTAIRNLHKPRAIPLPGKSIFNRNGTYIGEVGGGEAVVCDHCHSEYTTGAPMKHCAECNDTGDNRRDRQCECHCWDCSEAEHDDCDDNCGYPVCPGIYWADHKKRPFRADILWPCKTAELIYTSEELNQ